MKIINETELMTNQKASTVVVPDKQFEALQTIEGNSLLFSIGTDNILFCTREVPGDTHGWVRIDLSSSLKGQYNYTDPTKEFAAKTFDIAQDLSSNNSVDIALVVTYDGQDYLHLATGFTNTLDNWASSTPSFDQYLFDDYANMGFATTPVNEVQILDGNGSQYIILDLITNPANQTVSRYFIDTSKTLYTNPTTKKGCAWVPHYLTIDLQAGQVTTLLGCGPYDGPNGAANDIGGSYTLGKVGSSPQLMYAASFNFKNPEMTQSPLIFAPPTGSDASNMAMAVSAPSANAPYTDLFFASNGSLYFIAYGDQVNNGTGDPALKSIYTHSLFQGIQSMHIENWNNNIVLWGQSLGIDNISRLFIMEGVAGQETNADAWTCPIPLLLDVENSTTYINNKYSKENTIDPANGNTYGSSSVLFANISEVVDGNSTSALVQLFQDPVTSAWQERSILVVPNLSTEIYETTTYSTHIQVTDDASTALPNLAVNIWSSSPCNVYISDLNNTAAYHTLSNETPLVLTSDYTGNVTIMQPVDTIGGISYYVSTQWLNTYTNATETATAVVNPLTNTLSNINDNLGKNGGLDANVTDEYGKSTSLVNSNIDGPTKTAITTNLQTVYKQQSSVPADGTVTGQTWPTTVSAVSAQQHKTPNPAHLIKNLKFDPSKHKIHGIAFNNKKATFHDGIEAIKEMGVVLHADGTLYLTKSNGQLGSFLGAIESKAGHLFKWMKSEAKKLAAKLDNIIQVTVDGIIHCVFTIANEMYHFVVKCMNDLANIMHTLLNAIETAFEDIVKWIGSILGFADIYRTHQVLKNFFLLVMSNCINDLTPVQNLITTAFNDLETNIANLTGLPDSQESYNGNMSSATPTPGSTSPSSHWGTHHLKNNSSNATNTYSTTTPDDPGGVLAALETLFSSEEQDFTDAANQLKSIGATVGNTPVTKVITEIIGVIGELVVKSGKDLITATLNILQAFLVDSNNILNSEIDIPVISYLYGKITAFMNPSHEPDKFTLLDVMCLISAIPITIVYKLTSSGDAPFPDNEDTTNFTTVKDIATFQSYFTSVTSVGDHEGGSGGGGKYVTNANQLKWIKITNILGFVGSAGLSFFSGFKAFFPSPLPPTKVTINGLFSALSSVCYLGYVSPDLFQVTLKWNKWDAADWAADMNTICTIGATAKAVVDGFQPFMSETNPYRAKWAAWLDFFINFVWQIPTTVPFVQEMWGKAPSKNNCNEIVEFIGGTAFDISGMASPILTAAQDNPDPESRSIDIGLVVFAITAYNMIWGGSGLAVSFDRLPIPS